VLDTTLTPASCHRGWFVRGSSLNIRTFTQRRLSGTWIRRCRRNCTCAAISYFEALNEFLIVGASCALAVSNAFYGMSHLQEILDIPGRHLGTVSNLSSLSICLVMRSWWSTRRLCHIVLRGIRRLLLIIRVGSISPEESIRLCCAWKLLHLLLLQVLLWLLVLDQSLLSTALTIYMNIVFIVSYSWRRAEILETLL
jgi:hypothetical protein